MAYFQYNRTTCCSTRVTVIQQERKLCLTQLLNHFWLGVFLHFLMICFCVVVGGMLEHMSEWQNRTIMSNLQVKSHKIITRTLICLLCVWVAFASTRLSPQGGWVSLLKVVESVKFYQSFLGMKLWRSWGLVRTPRKRPAWSSEGRVRGWDSSSALQCGKQVSRWRLITKRPQLATKDC